MDYLTVLVPTYVQSYSFDVYVLLTKIPTRTYRSTRSTVSYILYVQPTYSREFYRILSSIYPPPLCWTHARIHRFVWFWLTPNQTRSKKFPSRTIGERFTIHSEHSHTYLCRIVHEMLLRFFEKQRNFSSALPGSSVFTRIKYSGSIQYKMYGQVEKNKTFVELRYSETADSADAATFLS